MKYPDLLRWVSFIASVAILLISLLFVETILGSKPTSIRDISVYIILAILPALTAAFLSLFRRFWWLVAPGLWYTVAGAFDRVAKESYTYPVIFILCGVILILTPIVGLATRRKE